MFVVTADQVDSRSSADKVAAMIDYLNTGPLRLILEADRTAGDELQVIVAHAEDALAIILHLTRTGQWSVGCGIGEVNTPLPANIRAATGGAFIAARRAVERAKKRQTRFALETEPETEHAADSEALIDLLLALRARRSAQGWELHDLMQGTDMTQTDAAAKLGISPQAVSLRARAGELRTEQAAIGPVTQILRELGSVEHTKTGGSA